MQKTLDIPASSRRDFYQQYLQVIKPLVNPRLTDGELRVLGELMFYTDKYKELDPAVRKVMLLDCDTRHDMMETLDISSNTFANALTVLRKGGFLTGRELKKSYQLSPEGGFAVNFNFKIK